MADFRVIIKSLIDNRTAYKNLADLKKNVQRTSREISKLDTQQANLGTKRSKLVQQLEAAAVSAQKARDVLVETKKKAEATLGEAQKSADKTVAAARDKGQSSIKKAAADLESAEAALGETKKKVEASVSAAQEKGQNSIEKATAELEKAGAAYDKVFKQVQAKLERSRGKYQSMGTEQQYAYADQQTRKQYPATAAAYTAADKNLTAAQAAAATGIARAQAEANREVAAAEALYRTMGKNLTATQESAASEMAKAQTVAASEMAKAQAAANREIAAAQKHLQSANNAGNKLCDALQDVENESERISNLQAGLRQTLEQQTAQLDKAKGSAARITGLFARLQQSASGLKRTLGQGLVGAFRKADGAVKRFANHLLRGNKFAKTFSSRLRRILMGALIFNAVSAALRNLVSGMGAALRQNTALSTAMANLKGAAYQCVAPLAAMLAPALTMVANAAAIALSYLAKLLSFFTGKSLAATKAEAAAIGAVGSAAKKAGKSLAAFDTINQLSDSSGGSGSQAITPNFSYEAQSPFLDQVKAAIEAGDWAGAGKLLADKLNSMVDNWDARAWGKRLGKKLNNGISFLYAFLIAFNWVALGGKLADAFNGMAEMIDWGHLGALFVAGISIALQLLAGFLANLDWAALDVDLSLFVQGALDELTRAISNADPAAIGAGIAQFIANIDWLGIATSAWELLLTALQSTQELLIAFFSELFGEDVGEMLGTFTTMALGIALALGAIAAAAGLLNIAIGLLTSPITLAVAAMAALIAIIVLVVQHWDELKATASDVWDGVTTTTKGAVNSIIGFINGMISAVTNGINAVIRALNSIQIDIPSWVPGLGGRHFGINMAELTAPQIPYLAQGAVIPANREFLAVLGDQKHGTNIEAPADLIRSIVREEIGGLQVTIRFEGNLAQLGRVLRPVIDTERKRKGATLIKGGAY